MSVPVSDKARVVWTYEDYRQMPDDGLRYEVLDGDLVVTPAPSITHQRIAKRVYLALVEQLERSGLAEVFFAPVDLIFSRLRTLQPDLAVVSSARAGIIPERGIEGAPDLVIEILSPSTEAIDRGRKSKLYADEGVREYWLVDADRRRIEVFVLGAVGYTLDGEYGSGTKVISRVFTVDLDVERVFPT